MFRHRGKTRTLSHNLQIASLLSFIAGIVNVVGFLSVQRLTTNVTGHFAYLMEEFLRFSFWKGLVYFLYILFFLFGAFCASLVTELVSRKSERYMYVAPVIMECLILFTIGYVGADWSVTHPDTIAFSLLFAMGLQNSLVTSISSSNVRTTHLTGLFTDLGIELSQLFIYKSPEQKKILLSSIRLHITIITFFFTGGIVGGFAFARIGMTVLMISAFLLLLGMIYDGIRFRVIQFHRKRTHR